MTSDVNLGKLVLLEVQGKVGNAKLAKKYFLMSEWGVPYIVGKLKRRAFQQAKKTGQSDTWLGRYGPEKSRD